MPTSTYTPLANLTLTGSAATVTFSSIDQSYKDLVLVVQVNAQNYTVSYINNDSSNSYFAVHLVGTGSTATSATVTEPFINTGGGLSNQHIWSIYNFMDYSATDKHKTILAKFNRATSIGLTTYRWANTAAITSIKVDAYIGSFSAGATFMLYGVAG